MLDTMKKLSHQVVMPGDDVTNIINEVTEDENAKYVIGPGLLRDGKRTKALTSGVMKMRDKPLVFWVQSHQRKYVPINGERVIGTVVSKSGFNARIDVGGTDFLSLSLLAFEGATKRNRPNIEVGDVVFARVAAPSRDVEAELVCMTSAGKRDGMGILVTPQTHFSQTISVSIHTVRHLLSSESKLLNVLGNKYRFEIAIGMNGRIWISTKQPENLIFISNTIQQSDSWTRDTETQFCDDLRGDVDFTLVNRKGKKLKEAKSVAME